MSVPERILRLFQSLCLILDSVPDSIIKSVPERITMSVPERILRLFQSLCLILNSVPECIINSVPECIIKSVPERIFKSVPERIATPAPERIDSPPGVRPVPDKPYIYIFKTIHPNAESVGSC